MKHRLFAIMCALLLVFGAAPAAFGALADLGIPIDPHGYPAWYQDRDGLRLELRLPPPAGNAGREDLCLYDPLNEGSDLIVEGESFWWLA